MSLALVSAAETEPGTVRAQTGCRVHAVELDFAQRKERTVPPAEIRSALEAGNFLWIDIDFDNQAELRQVLSELQLLSAEVLEPWLEACPPAPAEPWLSGPSPLLRHDECLQFTVCGCLPEREDIALERVDCVLGAHFMITLHRGSARLIEATKKAYHQDFLRFARSPSFLVYELWEQVIENYRVAQAWFEDRVEGLQAELVHQSVDDTVFGRVSSLGAALLHFRKLVLPARGVLADLATRRTLYLSETTQHLLANLVGSTERVLSDLLVDRDILSESLNLYMSQVAHRTNQVMRRLTVVSVVFLPLTFLCGVYGMNFEYLPELKWQYGYGLFWLAVVVIVGAIAWLSKRAKLL